MHCQTKFQDLLVLEYTNSITFRNPHRHNSVITVLCKKDITVFAEN